MTNLRNDEPESGLPPARVIIAGVVIVGTIVALAVLGAIVIVNDRTNALTLFNIVLPVMATWVGTVLAFYFGRENFESASRQARSTNAQLLQFAQLTQEERVQQPVTQAMRPIGAITYERLGGNRTAVTLTLAEVRKNYTDVVTRLPLLGDDLKPLYMIHASSIDKYLSDPNHADSTTLQQFLDDEARVDSWYDVHRGFELLPQAATIGDAKRAMESIPTVQDIFVTANGTADEPLMGWLSNTRLTRYLRT